MGPKETWHWGLVSDMDDQGLKPLPLGFWLLQAEFGESKTMELSQ